MATHINLGDITAEVTLKEIKNVHLGVYPPDGKVRISAPMHMNLDTVRVFAISKLGWIKKQQKKLREQPREAPREYLERESHYVWGRRYLLEVVEKDAPPQVLLKHRKLLIQVRPGADTALKQDILEAWYRKQLKERSLALIAKWEPLIGVRVGKIFAQRMKTKWGGCNPVSGHIRLNTDLAKKPPECLEYIVVHEMTHLLEPTHNNRFVALMDSFMPKWRLYKDGLNRLPVRHENWTY